jgi:hypothetical protein
MLREQEEMTPDYMRPNRLPVACIGEGFLTDAECNAIEAKLMPIVPYKAEHCGAMTRECGHVPELDPMLDFAKMINQIFWNYDLDLKPMSWLQTYYADGSYQKHMDYTPGGMRKLTAVLMLSEPDRYTGGDLELHFHPLVKVVPRTRGTIAVFQPWLLHEVTKVARGVRKTINMGFWGPPFR